MAVWIHSLTAALVACSVCLHRACTQAPAGGPENSISKTLADNTLEQTFVLNLKTDTSLSSKYTQAELDEISFQYLTTSEHADYFSLSSQTGNIKTSQLVDRDVLCPMQTECLVELNIATLPQTYFEVIKVMIVISDENDNAPKFPEPVLTYRVPETTPPGIITPLVPARDLDSPQNGISEYRLNDDSGVFHLEVVNNTDGSMELRLMLLDQLDRETVPLYYLQVVALDGGDPQRTGTLSLTIEVLDANDNHPTFELTTYDIDVPEDYAINRSFIQVVASDLDEGENGDVRYSFSADTQRSVGDYFYIDSITGDISLKTQLDFEERSSYTLTITAQDQGLHSIPSTAKVLVNVIDVNDVTPEIILNEPPEDGIIRIPENQEVPTYVGFISVRDFDSGENGRVVCVVSESETFQLDELYEKEFKIVAVVSLDRELRSQITLTIKCHDMGEPQRQSELDLQIEVIDADDNKPHFAHDKYIVNLEENNEIGAPVTQIKAYDVDAGYNGYVLYSLQNASADFAIDEHTGDITALGRFDREVRDLYEITILATDMGPETEISSTVVSIFITDMDDERPIFLPNQNTVFSVSEDAVKGTLIGTVTAMDADLPPNNNLTYYLDTLYNRENRFKIDSNSGNIFTNMALDRELQDSYELHIIAESTTTPSMRDSLFVNIDILDVNDNFPIISFPTADHAIITVSNTVPVGYKLTRIMAYDIDNANNANLTYQITVLQSNGMTPFQIDQGSGSIFVIEDLSSISQANFTVLVSVSDLGTPQKTSMRTVYISVNSSIAFVKDASAQGSSSNDSGTANIIPIIIGSICGAIVVTLLVVIAILLILRRRKSARKDGATSGMWVSVQKQSSYSSEPRVDDHVDGDGSGSPIGGVVTQVPDVQLTAMESQARSDSPHNSARDGSQGEKDSDSGCFDLSHSDSQSSADQHNQQAGVHAGPRGPNVIQMKSYQSHNNPNIQPNTSSVHRIPHNRQPLILSDKYTIIPPKTPAELNVSTLTRRQSQSPRPPVMMAPPVGGARGVGVSPNDSMLSEELPPPPPPLLGTYPISQASYINSLQPVENNQPFPPPPPQSGTVIAPQHYPRFTDYLQNESRELKQRGHVYRVSDKRNQKENPNQNRKTVRFSTDSKGDDSVFNDVPTLEQPNRAVPNNYVDCDLLKSIAMHRKQTLGSNSSEPSSSGRDSGVYSVRGLSTLELDSLV